MCQNPDRLLSSLRICSTDTLKVLLYHCLVINQKHHEKQNPKTTLKYQILCFFPSFREQEKPSATTVECWEIPSTRKTTLLSLLMERL